MINTEPCAAQSDTSLSKAAHPERRNRRLSEEPGDGAELFPAFTPGELNELLDAAPARLGPTQNPQNDKKLATHATGIRVTHTPDTATGAQLMQSGTKVFGEFCMGTPVMCTYGLLEEGGGQQRWPPARGPCGWESDCWHCHLGLALHRPCGPC